MTKDVIIVGRRDTIIKYGMTRVQNNKLILYKMTYMNRQTLKSKFCRYVNSEYIELPAKWYLA